VNDAAGQDPPPPLVSVIRHGLWAELRLERAAKRNALSWALAEDLIAALRTLAEDEVQVAVLSATGPVFCAGGDRQEAVAGRRPPLNEVVEALHAAPFFVIARVEGDVIGAGMALLAPCPVTLCPPSVTFLLPAAGSRDVFPDTFLPALGGVTNDRELLEFALRSEPLTADRAKEMGLVNAVVPAESMDEVVAGWVELLLHRPAATAGARRFWRGQRQAQLQAYGPSSTE
jgi:enoyl-CoA hydratase/carnithine racemase